MAERKSHPANVPGDFYVVDGCCTMCEVPFAEAPDLFGTFEDSNGCPHCYIKRQPESPAELDQMLGAVRCAEFECIRYHGADRLIQLRLAGADMGIICDGLPPDLQQEVDRRQADRQHQWQEHQKPQQTVDVPQPAPSRPWWRFW